MRLVVVSGAEAVALVLLPVLLPVLLLALRAGFMSRCLCAAAAATLRTGAGAVAEREGAALVAGYFAEVRMGGDPPLLEVAADAGIDRAARAEAPESEEVGVRRRIELRRRSAQEAEAALDDALGVMAC